MLSTLLAHPRVCGENTPVKTFGGYTQGSSPRVRGKRMILTRGASIERLIPACAGKTALVAARPLLAPAHPRVCGENHFHSLLECWGIGSSPRVRGKHSNRRSYRPRHRLIPACAGKTHHRLIFVNQTGAHPRVCGENARRHHHRRRLIGSSPRVRGKRRRDTEERFKTGLIPACAGKTGFR